MKELIKKWNDISLVKRIITGLVLGTILALVVPQATPVAILGELFVDALKGVAPLLVFFLVMAAISGHEEGKKTNMNSIVGLYLIGTFIAAMVAVAGSFMFPVELELAAAAGGELAPPGGVGEVLKTVLMNVVKNPVESIATANYIGILAWSVVIGFALKKSSQATKKIIVDISDVITQVVRWVINFAPFGIMGLVFDTIATTGLESLLSYGQLIILLVGCMAFVALVVNPIIAFAAMRRNPYPLIFKCLRESGITAFFTRSSAANIPVNMKLCKDLGLNEDTYSVSIPLGATINMGGAAITITVLTLAAANTLGIQVDIPTAIILSVLSAVSACGASGVAGGSLLLIPLACSLFGIPNDVAMQVVGIGFIVGVVQDSAETALNSSTDVVYTAVAEYASERKEERQKAVN